MGSDPVATDYPQSAPGVGRHVRFLIGAGSIVVLAVALTLPRPDGPRPFGFSRASARAHLELEQRFLALPDTAVIRDTHRFLTSEPHPAG